MKLPSLLAKRFLAGETLDQVVPKVWQINNENIDGTLDLLEKMQLTEKWRMQHITTKQS